MKITRLLKDKRGIAIENAVLFMVVVFMLCALLTSLTLMGFYQTEINTTLLDEKITIDQIGEDFVRGKISPATELKSYNETYFYTGTSTKLQVYRINGENKKLVLEVTTTNDNNENKVSEWSYK